MRASVHPVPFPGYCVNTSSGQVHGQRRCPYRSGITEGATGGTQTGAFGGQGSLAGTIEGAGGAGGSDPNHGRSTTTTATTTGTSSIYHQQQSSLPPHPPPLLPPASTLHHSFFLQPGYSDNSLPLPHHQSYYFLPPLQSQQLQASHGPTPPSFLSHLSDPPPPTSHSANRGYDPVHAARNSNNSMNNQGRTGRESGQDNSGNAGNNMNNQGGNRQEAHLAPSNAHQYGGNGNNNNSANNGNLNVTTPTTGVSAGYTVGPNWMPGFTYAPTASQGQPSSFHSLVAMPGGPLDLYASGMAGSSSGNMARAQGAQPADNPVLNSSGDADTIMGNTEYQGGSGGSSGPSAAPTAASAAPQGGGSGSGPIQSGGWTLGDGQSHSAFAFRPPETSSLTPPPPGLSSFGPGYTPFPHSSQPMQPHHLEAFGNNSTSTPSQVLPDPDPWGLRHTRPIQSGVITGSYQHHPHGPTPGHHRQHSHQSTQPPTPVTASSSTGSHVRLPAPDSIHFPYARLPPYRSSGMSNPTESGNDLTRTLQPPQDPSTPQGAPPSASSAHRRSRQRSDSVLTNATVSLPDSQSRGIASAPVPAPTSASASSTGPPHGQSISVSRGSRYPEMRDYLARALDRSDHSSDGDDDDLDFPDVIPGRTRSINDEAARLEQRIADQERAALMMRARQVARGQSSKKVASKKAIESLEPVNIADLPESDRSKLPCCPWIRKTIDSDLRHQCAIFATTITVPRVRMALQSNLYAFPFANMSSANIASKSGFRIRTVAPTVDRSYLRSTSLVQLVHSRLGTLLTPGNSGGIIVNDREFCPLLLRRLSLTS